MLYIPIIHILYIWEHIRGKTSQWTVSLKRVARSKNIKEVLEGKVTSLRHRKMPKSKLWRKSIFL